MGRSRKESRKIRSPPKMRPGSHFLEGLQVLPPLCIVHTVPLLGTLPLVPFSGSTSIIFFSIKIAYGGIFVSVNVSASRATLQPILVTHMHTLTSVRGQRPGATFLCPWSETRNLILTHFDRRFWPLLIGGGTKIERHEALQIRNRPNT